MAKDDLRSEYDFSCISNSHFTMLAARKKIPLPHRGSSLLKSEQDQKLFGCNASWNCNSKLGKPTRGKYAEAYKQGSNLVLLDEDVAKAFPDEKAANIAERRVSR